MQKPVSLSSEGNTESPETGRQSTAGGQGTLSKMGFRECRHPGEYQQSYLESLRGQKEVVQLEHLWVGLLSLSRSVISPGELFKTPTARSDSEPIKPAFLEHRCFLKRPPPRPGDSSLQQRLRTTALSWNANSTIPSAF